MTGSELIDALQADSDRDVARSRADLNARSDIAKRLPDADAQQFRARNLSIPPHLIPDNLAGHALEAAFAALIDAHYTIAEQVDEFRSKTELQTRWRSEEIEKAREEFTRQAGADAVELARLRRAMALVRRASLAGRKTVRVADVIAAADEA